MLDEPGNMAEPARESSTVLRGSHVPIKNVAQDVGF